MKNYKCLELELELKHYSCLELEFEIINSNKWNYSVPFQIQILNRVNFVLHIFVCHLRMNDQVYEMFNININVNINEKMTIFRTTPDKYNENGGNNL